MSDRLLPNLTTVQYPGHEDAGSHGGVYDHGWVVAQGMRPRWGRRLGATCRVENDESNR